MTRPAGQITTGKAVVGGGLIIAVALAIVTGLGLLVGAGQQAPPLDAPAEPVVAGRCPEPRNTASRRPVSSGDLIECPATYDGVTVRYRGEIVRAVLRRGERAWVQLNDDRYGLELGPLPQHRVGVGGNSGIPVSIPQGAADLITHVGDARHRGDVLDVSGTFLRADPDDGGGPAIRAETVTVTQVGGPTPRPALPSRAAVAAALALAVIAVRYARQRSS